MTTEDKYHKLLQLLADAAITIDFNADGNYTAVTTRVMFDGNLTQDFIDKGPKKVFMESLDSKLERWAKCKESVGA